ncbi:hypothetical protein UT300017_11620 [Clostridium sp. CTA-17]|nr:restriction endonuclease [Clostridium perfringens]MDM0714631.1 restriction endonuclease [Clostridium perfringens]MDU6311262.1 restriction endonuclease [Clostridium perfringens]
MNRFEKFFKNMTDEEWEKFSAVVLEKAGYRSLTLPAYGTDGGKDFFVEKDDIKYLVSCKHYINSGRHVGVDDEINIVDRLLQHDSKGFIGFYSTGITTGLQNRLDGICKNKQYHYKIFDPSIITTIMQSMDTKILQSFGLYPHKYYMNVSEDEYKPLKCVICGKDILTDKNIPKSIAGLTKDSNDKYLFIYGCKSCLNNIELYLNAFLEIEQALHLRIMQEWDEFIDSSIEEDKLELSEDFYEMRHKFMKGVRQRQLPQTDGNWYGLEI